MKVTLTTSEIIAKFGLTADTDLVIENDRNNDSGKWISNIGRNICSHPSSLSANTSVEVKDRYGCTYTGVASDWNLSWKEVNEDNAIVAYRFV